MVIFTRIKVLLAVMILAVSCAKVELKADLDLALRISGDNRHELEKVIEHYSKTDKDKLKLKAAKFLISNMIKHYSLSGEYMDNYIRLIDSVYADLPTAVRSNMYTVPPRISSIAPKIETELDLQNITAEFLINNIDYSFKLWETQYEKDEVPFEDFCEYILPYRVGNEPLVSWKDSTMCKYFHFDDLDVYKFDQETYSTITHVRAILYNIMDMKHFPDSIIAKYQMDCIDKAYNAVRMQRAMGVMQVVDFVPHYPTKENRHYWFVDINMRYMNNMIFTSQNQHSAKVFRKSYSINDIPLDPNNHVPEYLDDPYNKDVTECYEKVTDVKYKFGTLPRNTQYAYLAVFNSQSWREVAWSRIKRGRAVFKKMGREILYMPTYYEGKVQRCADYPIIVGVKGDVKELIPNHDELQTLTLKRKFTYSLLGEYTGRDMLHGRFEATNDIKAEKFDSISRVRSYSISGFDSIYTNTDKKYKYWIVRSGDHGSVSFGEVEFRNDKDEIVKGRSFSIGKDSVLKYDDSIIAQMFDNNILTFAYFSGKAGMEFSEPVNVSKIRIIPRNDANGIYPGNEYELLYFENGVWVSLGRKIATESSIKYDNAPTNALFWLRNHTEGKEERPFTVHDGRVRFW